jgi:hypothetical protein
LTRLRGTETDGGTQQHALTKRVLEDGRGSTVDDSMTFVKSGEQVGRRGVVWEMEEEN